MNRKKLKQIINKPQSMAMDIIQLQNKTILYNNCLWIIISSALCLFIVFQNHNHNILMDNLQQIGHLDNINNLY